MMRSRHAKTLRTIPFLIAACFIGLPASAKYSGGTGEPNDPYQIATAADLIALGEDPNDYDKHFILTADIDLDPNLPGRRVFDRAVIAPDTDPNTERDFEGTPFTGLFDGSGHTIAHVRIMGVSYVALFGRLDGRDTLAGEVRNLGVVDVNMAGSGAPVGGLVGSNLGSIAASYSSGSVSGGHWVGGLVGDNSGNIATSYSSVTVSGTSYVGGLVGSAGGSIVWSYSSGAVSGGDKVGGLVGGNSGRVVGSYSSGAVSGTGEVGGLVGWHGFRKGPPMLERTPPQEATISLCWSTGEVSGTSYVGGLVGRIYHDVITSSYSSGSVSGTDFVGGLVGWNTGSINSSYSSGSVSGTGDCVGGLVGSGDATCVGLSFWDTQTSGQIASAGGRGLTTAEMHTLSTFLQAGWDFSDEVQNGTCDYWQMSPGGYPLLRYDGVNRPLMPDGLGTAEQPYLIRDARDLGTVWFEPLAHYRLAESVDLSEITWSVPVIPWFAGSFDGDGHTISHLTITGRSDAGLFGRLEYPASVSNLGLEIVDVNGTGDYVGGLASLNIDGRITASYSSGSVSGISDVGGLVGQNWGSIAMSYSSASVRGDEYVGGLVGDNSRWGNIVASYSTGSVIGTSYVGGLVGDGGWATSSFWDIQTSGQVESYNGAGKTTAEMQTAKTFLDAGWDFVGETVNGPNDVWKIVEGETYPLLSWQKYSGGTGEPNDPYQIATAADLIALGETPDDYDKHFLLTADIDLDPNLPGRKVFDRAVIAPDIDSIMSDFQGTSFTGVFDGKGRTISHLTIDGSSYLGLFGLVSSPAEVRDVRVVDVNVTGSGRCIGGGAGCQRQFSLLLRHRHRRHHGDQLPQQWFSWRCRGRRGPRGREPG